MYDKSINDTETKRKVPVYQFDYYTSALENDEK